MIRGDHTYYESMSFYMHYYIVLQPYRWCSCIHDDTIGHRGTHNICTHSLTWFCKLVSCPRVAVVWFRCHESANISLSSLELALLATCGVIIFICYKGRGYDCPSSDAVATFALLPTHLVRSCSSKREVGLSCNVRQV